MNFTVFALAKEEIYVLIENLCDRSFASKLKYFRLPDFGNVVAELYAKKLTTKAINLLRESPPFLYCSVLEKAILAALKANNAQHRTVRFRRLWSMNGGQ